MALFKPTWTVWRDAAGNRVKASTPGATKTVGESDIWWTRYKDAAGNWQRENLKTKDEKLARIKAARQIVDVEEDRDSGPQHRQQRRPLSEHVADFRANLLNKNKSAKHVAQQIGRVERALQGCGFVFWKDLSTTRLYAWLAEQRELGEFQGCTSNGYIQAVGQFCNWMVHDRRARDNPFAHAEPVNTVDDVTRDRRAIGPDEFPLLILATEKSTRHFRRLTGRDRAALYLLAFYTGFRAGELSSLTRQSFDLDGDPPTVTVHRSKSKGRRSAKSSRKRRQDDVQPLRADFARYLAAWLETRPDDRTKATEGNSRPCNRTRGERFAGRLWASDWKNRAAAMLRDDMRAARAVWLRSVPVGEERRRRRESDFLQPLDSDGEHFDFHSWRHSLLTHLDHAKVSPRDMQQLGRHSDFSTTQLYIHGHLFSAQEALDKLPALPAAGGDDSERQTLRATGTDGARPPPVDPPRTLRVVNERSENLASACQTQSDSVGSKRRNRPAADAGDDAQETTEAAKPQEFNAASDARGATRIRTGGGGFAKRNPGEKTAGNASNIDVHPESCHSLAKPESGEALRRSIADCLPLLSDADAALVENFVRRLVARE